MRINNQNAANYSVRITVAELDHQMRMRLYTVRAMYTDTCKAKKLIKDGCTEIL